MNVRTTGPQPWPSGLEGQERLQQEIAELNQVAGTGGVTMGDLPEGQKVFIVPTPDPPGYILYLKTGPDYPEQPPALLAEKNGRQLTLSSRTITNWRPHNRLAEVVVELTGQANQRRFLVLGGLFGLAAVFLIGLALLMFLGGETRIEQASVDGTAGAVGTKLARSSDRLSTAIAQATATVQADPRLGDAPNPTLTAAVNDLLNLRNQNESALATVTAVAHLNQTATADAVNRSNSQTQAAFIQALTATAGAQQTATSAALTAAVPPTRNPLPRPTATPVYVARPTARPANPTPKPANTPVPPTLTAPPAATSASQPTAAPVQPAPTPGPTPDPTSQPMPVSQTPAPHATTAPPQPTTVPTATTLPPQPTIAPVAPPMTTLAPTPTNQPDHGRPVITVQFPGPTRPGQGGNH